MPEAAQATITIYDVSGKTSSVFEGDYAKGYNKVEVEKADVGSGVLYYQLELCRTEYISRAELKAGI